MMRQLQALQQAKQRLAILYLLLLSHQVQHGNILLVLVQQITMLELQQAHLHLILSSTTYWHTWMGTATTPT